MHLSTRAASAIASTLPSCRVVLLFGGVLALSESVALAMTLFAGAFVSFAAGLVVAAVVYRRAAPLLAEDGAVPDEAASIAAGR